MFANALDELPTGSLQEGRPGIMLALVPAPRTVLQGFVIAVLVLFDEALKADVAADLQTQRVALPQPEQPGVLVMSISFDQTRHLNNCGFMEPGFSICGTCYSPVAKSLKIELPL
jgi:hypothetical protein